MIYKHEEVCENGEKKNKTIFKCMKMNFFIHYNCSIYINVREFWLILPVMYARLKG